MPAVLAIARYDPCYFVANVCRVACPTICQSYAVYSKAIDVHVQESSSMHPFLATAAATFGLLSFVLGLGVRSLGFRSNGELTEPGQMSLQR